MWADDETNWLRHFRCQAGLSRASLSELSGVSCAWIVQLERDHLFSESGGRKLERLVRDASA